MQAVFVFAAMEQHRPGGSAFLIRLAVGAMTV
jgi:hypothetical protein